MTDKEIIQDFEEIVEDYRDEYTYDFYLKLRNVLDLIEKQQAEIENDRLCIELEKKATDKAIKEIEKKDNQIKSKDKEIKLLKEFHNKHIKIIDLMAEMLVKDHEWFYSEFDNYTKEQFIEYFTNKVEAKE